MTLWEQRIGKALARLGLARVRRKILVFAVLATTVPSFATGWISFSASRQAMAQKVNERLAGTSLQAAREMTLWFREQLHTLHVFTSSYEVTENLDRGVRTARLSSYLSAVLPNTPDYEMLVVVAENGRQLASSSRRAPPFALPKNWEAAIRAGDAIVGAALPAAPGELPRIPVLVPIRSPDGRLLGALGAVVRLRGAWELLRRVQAGTSDRLYLAAGDGSVVLAVGDSTLRPDAIRLSPPAARTLLRERREAAEYRSREGQVVLGLAASIPEADWWAVAEVPREEAFRQLARLRNLTLLTVGVLAAGLGAIAYVIGLVLVRPLDRLTTAAAQVAAGDLTVDLPEVSGGEIGYLTQVFNDMVSRLRQSRQALDAANAELVQKNLELKHLSVTDSLTGLFNRRHMRDQLENEVNRARRQGSVLTVLMLDIDHFKPLNDRFGHQVGDEILVAVAGTIRETIRSVDYAARYGGEEFLVILPNTSAAEARVVADRILLEAARGMHAGPERQSVTLSGGMACFPADGQTPEAVIARADAALYEAKQAGRNRVVGG